MGSNKRKRKKKERAGGDDVESVHPPLKNACRHQLVGSSDCSLASTPDQGLVKVPCSIIVLIRRTKAGAAGSLIGADNRKLVASPSRFGVPEPGANT
jgi:hypothetical protein